MNNLELKNNVKEFRLKAKLSQQELAEKVGTTRQTIIAIEKGVFSPTAKLALLLTYALGCTFEELFYF